MQRDVEPDASLSPRQIRPIAPTVTGTVVVHEHELCRRRCTPQPKLSASQPVWTISA
ncbi:hypothetical protein [Burkholderia sp. MSMB1835]|uniref:hypothetical protein n=1 Tax=Burkholderia sp. MSMB1835 TaxID=1637876 RepID=UPI000AA1687E|nr:hypothetical protein [Burkholderia sp. MSMB1835]